MLLEVNAVNNLSVLGTAARAHRTHGFHFLLVECVLKCSVAHTWRRTSASLNYERFHDHQVKLKKVHFYLSTLKEGCKYSYIILEASA